MSKLSRDFKITIEVVKGLSRLPFHVAVLLASGVEHDAVNAYSVHVTLRDGIILSCTVAILVGLFVHVVPFQRHVRRACIKPNNPVSSHCEDKMPRRQA